MANVRVSEMATATEIADDDYIYLVDTSEGVNGSKKVSVGEFKRSISSGMGQGVFPDWNADMSAYANWQEQEDPFMLTIRPANPLTLFDDAFVYKYYDETHAAHLNIKIGNKIFDESDADAKILCHGILVKAGTTITHTFSEQSGVGTAIYVVPLVKES